MKNLPMQYKVFVAILCLVGLIVSAQAIMFPLQYTEMVTQGLDEKARNLTQLMAQVSSSSLEFDDKEFVQKLFKSASLDPDVVNATLYRESGEVFYALETTKVRPLAGLKLGESAITFELEDRIISTAPIVSDAGAKGVLALEVRTERIRDEARAFLVFTLLSGLVILVLSGVVAWFLVRGIEVLARKVAALAKEIEATSAALLAGSRQQEHGATMQSAAVEETRRTLDNLTSSGRQITDAAQLVLKNAERTQANNQLLSDRIRALTGHTVRITEILEVIKDIANKSDLLALNAALEGTKAGEEGRRFSLVASQMQGLAEDVMGSVRDIKKLTADIREASNASVAATEEATKLAANTTTSARQISLIIQQQQAGTEQVTQAMDDVARVAQESIQTNHDALGRVEAQSKLTRDFLNAVAKFRRTHDARGEGRVG